MGFGLAAVLFAPLKKLMIGAWGVDGTLFVLGSIVFILAVAGAALIRNPPEGTDPLARSSEKEITPAKFIRTPVFYGLWAALAAVIGGGLTAIGLLSAFGMGAATGYIGSRLFDITGSFTPAFLLAGGTTVIGLIVVLFLRQKLR